MCNNKVIDVDEVCYWYGVTNLMDKLNQSIYGVLYFLMFGGGMMRFMEVTLFLFLFLVLCMFYIWRNNVQIYKLTRTNPK